MSTAVVHLNRKTIELDHNLKNCNVEETINQNSVRRLVIQSIDRGTIYKTLVTGWWLQTGISSPAALLQHCCTE